MAPALPSQFVLETSASHMAMLMAKYGALDLTFTSTHVLAAADAITWDALEKLSLAESRGVLAEEFKYIEKTLSDDVCYLHVFLTWVLPSAAMDFRNEQASIEITQGGLQETLQMMLHSTIWRTPLGSGFRLPSSLTMPA